MTVPVSIVIPVFNKVRFLEECVQSAIAQRGVGVEVICIDDASTDGSADLLDDLCRGRAGVRLARNAQNLGPGAARNRGISLATGEFVRFLDADDLLPPDSSAVLYESAIRHSADLVRGSLLIFRDPDRTKVQSLVTTAGERQTRFADDSSLWIPWWHTSYLISLRLLRRHRLRYPELRRGEDPVFMASVLLKAESISLVEEVVYNYRKYPKSTGSGAASFEDVLATLEHAEMVKSLYCAENPDFWFRGYGPYLRADVQQLLDKSRLQPEQRRIADGRVSSIWN